MAMRIVERKYIKVLLIYYIFMRLGLLSALFSDTKRVKLKYLI